MSALKQENESDYTLTSNHVWITVGNLSLYIRKTREGVIVDIYPKDKEADQDAIATTKAMFNDVENEVP